MSTEKDRARWRRYSNRHRAKRKAWHAAHPEVNRARYALRRAIRSGKVRRPQWCSRCHRKGKIEAHHWHGYSDPLDVQWLCSRCHARVGHGRAHAEKMKRPKNRH